MDTRTVADGETRVPFRERIGCTVKEACEATGLKPTKLYELIAAGAIESQKVDKRRIIVVRSLQRLIEGPSTDGKSAGQLPGAA